jgi:hypothetical protein
MGAQMGHLDLDVHPREDPSMVRQPDHHAPPRAVVGPSRFTHIGRHLEGLRLLVECCDTQALDVALVGSGPIEPFVVAEIISTAEYVTQPAITAVDADAAVASLLLALLDGREVDIGDLAEVCRDDIQDPCSSHNANFAERLDEGLREFVGRNLRSPIDVKGGRLRARLSGEVSCEGRHATAHEFLFHEPDERYDLIYLGLVLNQLRKQPGGYDMARNLLGEIKRCLRPSGLLGIGTSLSPAHGVACDVRDVTESGLSLLYVSLENVILSDGAYYGDYGLGVGHERGCAANGTLGSCRDTSGW